MYPLIVIVTLCASTPGIWSMHDAPPAKYGAATAGLANRVVLFGGHDGLAPVAQTWEWDGNNWIFAPVTNAPPRRMYASMASFQGKVVLFGGITSTFNGVALADTWEWDGVRWTERHPAVSPPAGFGGVMAQLGNELILFGGGPTNDTWVWDGTSWALRITAIAPALRSSASMAQLNNKLLLFGGLGVNSTSLADTWEFDGAAWTLRQPATSPPPTYARALVPMGSRLLLCMSGTTWDWNGMTWTQISNVGGPSSSSNQCAPIGTRTMMFVGGETWEFGGVTWSLRRNALPPRRAYPAVVGFQSSLLLFGGEDNGLRLGDTWRWTHAGWTQLQPATSPTPRMGAAVTVLGTKVVLFGGSVPFAETWEWDGTNWALRTPVHSPPGRILGTMAALGNKAVLFGGFGSNGTLTDTWEWDGVDWTERVTTLRPGDTGAMAAVGSRLLLVAGSDVWAWDSSTWTLVPRTTGPSARTYLSVAALSSKLVLFSGGFSTGIADTWAHDGTSWDVISSVVTPQGRVGGGLATLGDAVYLLGGESNSNAIAGFWKLTLPPVGTACVNDGECVTGFCTDGVCCERRCGDACEACAETGAVGRCLQVTGAPRGRRSTCSTDGSVCGGTCDGTSAACRYPAATTNCRAATCSAGNATAAARCDGLGACLASTMTSCAPYLCGGATCGTRCVLPTDCATGAFCKLGACVPLQLKGSTCTDATQCASGHCVDGVCCDQECKGQCEACSSTGFCGPIFGVPRGNRTPCGIGPCGATCEGQSRTCSLPSSQTSCTASCGTASNCDGAGECVEPANCMTGDAGKDVPDSGVTLDGGVMLVPIRTGCGCSTIVMPWWGAMALAAWGLRRPRRCTPPPKRFGPRPRPLS